MARGRHQDDEVRGRLHVDGAARDGCWNGEHRAGGAVRWSADVLRLRCCEVEFPVWADFPAQENSRGQESFLGQESR